jgi:hypothetical protein
LVVLVDTAEATEDVDGVLLEPSVSVDDRPSVLDPDERLEGLAGLFPFGALMTDDEPEAAP